MTEPTAFIVFGSTGNLAQTRIFPALFRLMLRGELKEPFKIVAFSRRAWTNDDYRAFIAPSIEHIGTADDRVRFLGIIAHHQGELDDPTSYEKLAGAVIDHELFFHCAVHTDLYATIVEQLGKASLCGTLIFEKPFGTDEASAQKLEDDVVRHACGRIARIDHYLGKPALDSFIQERRKNPELCNPERIASIACRSVEDKTIDTRGVFYDAVGALRDVGQNHVLEMLATVLMDDSGDGAGYSRGKAIESLVARSVVRGQYEGYRETEGIPADSDTETYFKAYLASADPCWKHVELSIEGGKGFSKKQSEIVITYIDGVQRVIDIEKTTDTRDAYEVVLGGILKGETDRLVSSREIMASWRLVDVLRSWFEQSTLHVYPKGSELDTFTATIFHT